MALLTACAPPRTDVAELPSARHLIDRYNARTQKIERFAARGVVEIRWIDEKGKEEFEQADLDMLFRKPNQIALSISKAFERYYWLGCDAQRFWWFDLNPQDDLPNTAYVGHHEDLDPRGRQASPSQVLIPPGQLIELLGVTDLPASVQQSALEPVRGKEKAAVVFRIPVEFAGQPAEQHIVVGAITARPLSITFFDNHGGTVARAELSGYKWPGVGPGGTLPAIATRILVTVPDRKVELKINLFSESITADPEKFSDAQFDFDALVRALKPEQVKVMEQPPGE